MLSSWEDDDQVHEHTKHKKHSTNFLHKWFSDYSHKPSQTPAPTPTPTQTPVPVPTLTATQPDITRPIPPHPPPNQPTHTSPPSSAHSRIHTHAGGHSLSDPAPGSRQMSPVTPMAASGSEHLDHGRPEPVLGGAALYSGAAGCQWAGGRCQQEGRFWSPLAAPTLCQRREPRTGRASKARVSPTTAFTA